MDAELLLDKEFACERDVTADASFLEIVSAPGVEVSSCSAHGYSRMTLCAPRYRDGSARIARAGRAVQIDGAES